MCGTDFRFSGFALRTWSPSSFPKIYFTIIFYCFFISRWFFFDTHTLHAVYFSFRFGRTFRLFCDIGIVCVCSLPLTRYRSISQTLWVWWEIVKYFQPEQFHQASCAELVCAFPFYIWILSLFFSLVFYIQRFVYRFFSVQLIVLSFVRNS